MAVFFAKISGNSAKMTHENTRANTRENLGDHANFNERFFYSRKMNFPRICLNESDQRENILVL